MPGDEDIQAVTIGENGFSVMLVVGATNPGKARVFCSVCYVSSVQLVNNNWLYDKSFRINHSA